jgi:hypothetical protein
MPALNFKARFAALVEAGKKRQTIRAMRKDGRDVAPGDVLYLYTGMRTKACRKLMETVCASAEPIGIGRDGFVLMGDGDNFKKLAPVEIEDLARADGFDTVAEFLGFFKQTHGLPFNGMLIKW